jgi:phosphotriesterase-related protein
MAAVQTVTGPIESAQLGFTLMHEHILIANWSMRMAVPGWLDRDAFVARAIREVESAKQRGVRTIVDLTPVNLGRDIDVIRAVAEGAEMQIIAATGFYWTEEPFFQGWEVDRLVEFLLPDLEKGIQGTDARAGIIKCATDHLGVTPLNDKLLRVAARLHRATGAPISTHTSSRHRTGLAQQEIFADEGVDLSRVVIGHCGDTTDLEYLKAIIARGSTIGMDRFGLDMLLPFAERVSTVARLCQAGFCDRMVLSHDASCHIDWFPPQAIAELAPRWNLRHISDDVLPALRGEGVSEPEIDALCIANPRRVFARQDPY